MYFDIPPPNITDQTDVILLEYVNVQCSHLYFLIMWQMVRTMHIFHKKYQSFTSKVTDSNYDNLLIKLSNTTSKSYNLSLFFFLM